MTRCNEDFYAIDELDLSIQRLGCVEDSILYVNLMGKSVNKKTFADLYMRIKRLRRDLISILDEVRDAQEDYEDGCPCPGQGCD